MPFLIYRKAHDRAKDEKDTNGIDWALNIRFPLVAITGAILRSLKHPEDDENLFSQQDSKQLIDSLDGWVSEIFDPAFESLKGYFDRNASPSQGVRSIVRKRDWMDQVVRETKRLIDAQIRLEQSYIKRNGLSEIGLIANLPNGFIVLD